ncbi:MAG: hypothetical protein ACREQ5_12020, partial [Candidatus Dormibacteria bacterium]
DRRERDCTLPFRVGDEGDGIKIASFLKQNEAWSRWTKAAPLKIGSPVRFLLKKCNEGTI